MSTTVLSIYAMHALFRFCIPYLNDAWSRSTNPNVRNKASLVLIPYESQIGVPCSMFDVAYNVKLSKEEEYRHAVLGFIRWFNMSANGDNTKTSFRQVVLGFLRGKASPPVKCDVNIRLLLHCVHGTNNDTTKIDVCITTPRQDMFTNLRIRK